MESPRQTIGRIRIKSTSLEPADWERARSETGVGCSQRVFTRWSGQDEKCLGWTWVVQRAQLTPSGRRAGLARPWISRRAPRTGLKAEVLTGYGLVRAVLEEGDLVSNLATGEHHASSELERVRFSSIDFMAASSLLAVELYQLAGRAGVLSGASPGPCGHWCHWWCGVALRNWIPS